ncbi:MAG: PilZ domain-containing protein [Gemmataceae bacterium]
MLETNNERPDAAKAVERRTSVRYSCAGRGPGTLVNVFNNGPAFILDISTDGVRLLVSKPLAPGDILALEIRNRHQQYLRTLWLRIVRASESTFGSWIVGAALLHSLSQAEVEDFLDQCVDRPEPEHARGGIHAHGQLLNGRN